MQLSFLEYGFSGDIGFMKMKWFRKKFKRFSISHGYTSKYTINQFRSNLDYIQPDFSIEFPLQNPELFDQSNNYKKSFIVKRLFNLTFSS